MATFKRILMPTDFSSQANQALRYAATLADTFKADLTLLHIVTIFDDDPNVESHDFPDIESFYKQLDDSAHARMKEYAPHYEKVKIKNVTQRSVSPADEILNYARNNQHDLIVMGTHGRSAITHFLVGSVAEKVVRHSSCPVVTVSHQEKDVMYDYPEIKKLLVPLDFSDYSKAALEPAAELAKQFKAEVTFLHVIEQRIHPAYYVMGEQSMFQVFPELQERSTEKLKEFADSVFPADIKKNYNVIEGKPHSEIIELADENDMDMIVMATHGLSGLEKFLIGSTTEKVVRKADCPVFTVKPQES